MTDPKKKEWNADSLIFYIRQAKYSQRFKSDAEIARKAGITPRSLSYYRCKKKVPSETTIGKIATALDVHPEMLMQPPPEIPPVSETTLNDMHAKLIDTAYDFLGSGDVRMGRIAHDIIKLLTPDNQVPEPLKDPEEERHTDGIEGGLDSLEEG